MASILVVDDDDIVAEHATEVLINAGHACGWVGSAEDALKVLKSKRPDLMLLDQNMPGQNGQNLLRRLRNSPRFYDLPVIMLTGVTGLTEEEIAYFNGAQDYIRKPFGEKVLVFRVNQVLKARSGRPSHRTLRDQLGLEPGDPVTELRLIG